MRHGAPDQLSAEGHTRPWPSSGTSTPRKPILILIAVLFGCAKTQLAGQGVGRCALENSRLIGALNGNALTEAQTHCDLGLQFCPHSAGLWTNCGKIQLRQMQFDSAREDFRKAIGFNPNQAQAYEKLGELAVMRGDLNGAKKRFEEALKIDPELVSSRGHLGIALYQAHDRPGGREVFKQLLASSGRIAEARIYLGAMALFDDETGEAVTQFSWATRLDPKSEAAWSDLGVAYAEAGRSDDAVAAFRSCLAANPRSSDCQRKLDAITGNSRYMIDDSLIVVLLPKTELATTP